MRTTTVSSRRASLVPGLLAVALGLAGCTGLPTVKEQEGPSSILVDLVEGETGCDSPLPLSHEGGWTRLVLDLQMLDAQGDPYDAYDGRVMIKMIPGKVKMPLFQMQGGRLEHVAVDVRYGFGDDCHVLVEAIDEGGEGVAGVGPRLCFENPTVQDVQTSDRSYRSPMNQTQVHIDGGTLVATGISQKGFFLTDVSRCVPKPETPTDGSSALDCSRSHMTERFVLYGTEPYTFVADELLQEEGFELVVAGEADPGPFPEDQYQVRVDGARVSVSRVPGSQVPEGTPLALRWVSARNALYFGSLYVFTFHAPFGVDVGSRLCSVSGAVTEFLGLTEIGFPTYRVYLEGGAASAQRTRPYSEEEVPDPRDDESYIFVECPMENPDWKGPAFVPDPIRLKGADFPGAEVPVYDDRHMVLDPYESALVELHDVRLPTQWRSCDIDGSRMVDRCYDQDREEGRCDQNQKDENDCEMACTTAGAAYLRPGERPEDYVGCTELTNYRNFGQFVADVYDDDGAGHLVRTGRVNVNTRENIPEFDPEPVDPERPYGRLYPDTDHERLVRGFKKLRGILFQVDSARPVWMIVPRSIEDIEFDFVEED